MSKMTYENWMAYAEARRQRVRERMRNSDNEMALPYVEAQETVRILGPALIRAGFDISIEEKRSVWNPDGPLNLAYRAWHRATCQLQRHREAMNEEPSPYKQMGKRGIVERAKERAWKHLRKITTRPHLAFSVKDWHQLTGKSTGICLYAEMRLDPETNKIVPFESSQWCYGNKETIHLPIPLTWAEQIAHLGTPSIDNRIIRSAKYIGDFGGVPGYKAEWYAKGKYANQWTLKRGYIGKPSPDVYKLVSSSVHLARCSYRAASDKFGEELLGAL